MNPLVSSLRSKSRTCTSPNHVRYTSIASHVSGLRTLKSPSERGPARTRFAPSPTGFLHLGSLRTALFNFLIARATGGQFILRIEDTDQKRTIPGAVDRLFDDLKWAGIKWDEGPDLEGPFGPYVQSQRISLYKKHAEQLLESGSAYRCFCSPQRLASLASHQRQLGLPMEYDRLCAQISKEHSDVKAASGDAHVIRLLCPDVNPPFHDLVYGLVRQKGKPPAIDSFDDPVLLKSDGFPTYHLANVVDDHHMKITDVIRGAEWMTSTHKHIAIYQAFGWEPPSFAHVGLLLDKSRQKLSKRAGSVDVSSFRSEGIFPETLTNFVALLGWSHNRKDDVMSLEDLIKHASMKYTKGDTVVSFEKLSFLQRRHARRYSRAPCSDNPLQSLHYLAVLPIVKELDNRASLEDFSTYAGIPTKEARESYIKRILEVDSNNYLNPRDFIQRNTYFFVIPSTKVLERNMPAVFGINETSPQDMKINFEALLTIFRIIHEINIDEWDMKTLRERVNFIVEQQSKLSKGSETNEADKHPHLARIDVYRRSWSKFVHEYLRWALCAGKPGPDGISTLFLLGKSDVSERLSRAENLVRKKMQESKMA